MAEPVSPLIITLEHDGPMPLDEFSGALDRLASRYGRYSRQHGDPDDARLYISRIREGSIEVALVNIAVAAQPLIHAAGSLNTLIGYGKNVAGLLQRFKSGSVSKAEISLADCDDARAMVKPVLHTEGGGLIIAINGDGNTVQPLIIIDAQGAREIDNRAAMLRAELALPQEDRAEQVLFVWDQIRDAPAVEDGKRSPDRGVIAALDAKAHPVTFADPAAKEAMYRTDENPFELGFIVDAKVLLGPRGPAGFRITKLHDTIPLDPAA